MMTMVNGGVNGTCCYVSRFSSRFCCFVVPFSGMVCVGTAALIPYPSMVDGDNLRKYCSQTTTRKMANRPRKPPVRQSLRTNRWIRKQQTPKHDILIPETFEQTEQKTVFRFRVRGRRYCLCWCGTLFATPPGRDLLCSKLIRIMKLICSQQEEIYFKLTVYT